MVFNNVGENWKDQDWGIVIWVITWSILMYRSVVCNVQACWKDTICYQKVNHVVEKMTKL